MKYIVAKPFSTPFRRLAVGQEITPAEVDGPAPFSRWVELGHLEPPAAERPAKGKTSIEATAETEAPSA